MGEKFEMEFGSKIDDAGAEVTSDETVEKATVDGRQLELGFLVCGGHCSCN